ncbi:hypothetical protein [Streptomyces albidoflavus]|uniref:hypothetical protein n=1 Tax=Streptomyces albidoflavus TaxID=1886 RepID=UPI00345327EC
MTAYEACPGVGDVARRGASHCPAPGRGVSGGRGHREAPAHGAPTHEDPFVTHGVAEYVMTTLTPGRVHPALAQLPAEDG